MNVERMSRSLFTYVVALSGDEVKALYTLINQNRDGCGQHNLDLLRALGEQCPDALRRFW